jgi:hypothetical protein
MEAGSERQGQEDEVHTMDVGEGNVVKLDKLGPMIINSDGVGYFSFNHLGGAECRFGIRDQLHRPVESRDGH